MVADDIGQSFSDQWQSQIWEFSSSITKWTGNQASMMEVEMGELPGLIRGRPPVWKSIERDAINVYGTAIRQLKRSAS